MSGRVFVDRFTVGLEDLKRWQQRDKFAVARVLAKEGRFSIFEATENQTIARTMEALDRCGWFVFEPQGFPWTKVTLTDAGRLALGIETGATP